jgi:SAM-dependent methyltransferase
MTADDALLWTDRARLRDVQYRTDANLAARQSIYAFQHPPLDLPARVLELAALPVRDQASDLTLAMHMLYHVPAPQAAVRELRRVTRPGGRVLVVLNGRDHLRELRDLIATALRGLKAHVPPPGELLRLDDGQDLLASEFTSVARHDFTGTLLIPRPGPVEDYVRSMVIAGELPDPGAFAAAVGRLVPTATGPFSVRTHAGCFVCS